MNEKQKLFIEIFKKNAGNIAVACMKVGIHRDTYYEWLNKPFFIEKDENGNDIQVPNNFKSAAKEVKENTVDFTESALIKKIAGITTKNIKIKEVLDKNGDIVRLREEIIINHPPDTGSIIWLLKNLGRIRGWSDKTEMKIDNDNEFRLTVEQLALMDKLSIEDKKELTRISKKFMDN